MARPTPARASKLTAEERNLEKEADELRRKEKELERQLKMLPAKLEARRSKEKELARLRAHTASPAISLNGARGF